MSCPLLIPPCIPPEWLVRVSIRPVSYTHLFIFASLLMTKMKKLPPLLRIALQTAANNSKINSKYVLAFAAFGALLIAGYGKRCLREH